MSTALHCGRAALLLLLAGTCCVLSEHAPASASATASAPAPAPASPPAGRRTRAAPPHSWLQLLAEYGRATGSHSAPRGDAGDADEWFPRPVPLTLPLGRSADNKPVSVPVLVVPVPVPAHHTPARAPAAGSDVTTQCMNTKSSSGDSGGTLGTIHVAGHEGEHAAAPYGDAPPGDAPYGDVTAPSAPPQLDNKYLLPGDEPSVPHLDYVVSSQQLVELFREQVAPHAELPPAVIPDYTAIEEGGEPAEEVPLAGGAGGGATRLVRLRRYEAATPTPPAPPAPRHALRNPLPPRYERSLLLRGELTVPRAGYSEPYTVWWDANSGASRVDLHGGATSTYRTMLPDGRMQFVEMRVDRSGEGDVRRCAVSAARAPAAADRALPALPDMRGFSFAGYVQAESGAVVERWTQTLAGGSGELGAGRGEALTFRHEVVVARAPDNYTTTPLRYSVSVDSSVLGPNSDGYVHRYTELREQTHDPTIFNINIGESCEETEQTERRDRLEPLREFTMLHHDPRHEAHFQQFKTGHRRQYWDDTEESVRKNLLMQHSRFVNSGNRQGATFALEMNHLGDRLDAELGVLRGVREDEARDSSEQFPHSRDQLAAQRPRLPRRFDWRQHGAVTHVRNQGSCSSCWAFAVAGSVEGALFVKTRRLVPLSEQCLVDCAHPYGGHGCGGTWPSAAYRYIQERGLPALDDYTPYQEKVLTCKDKSVPPVTHITSHVNVTKNSVQALKVAIRQHAPTVVIIDASTKSFIFYKKGVVYDDRCAKNKAEHAVLAVGWGEHRKQTHFILKNSWSAAWGDAGYVRLQAPSNTCGVLSRPSYPRLETRDVDRLPQQ